MPMHPGQASDQQTAVSAGVSVPRPDDNLSAEQARAVIRELRARQNALELQNDELRRTRQALKASLVDYLDLYDHAPVGYLAIDERGMVLTANRTASSLCGVTKRALIRRPLSDFIVPEDWEIYRQHRTRVFADHMLQRCELRFRRKNGDVFWAQLEGTARDTPDRPGPVCRVVMSDISERKRMEAALLASEQRYTIALSAISDGLWDWHIPSGGVFFSEQYFRLLGYDNYEFAPSFESWRSLVHPEDIDAMQHALHESIGAGRGFETHFRMRTKAGDWLWVAARGKVVEQDQAGSAVRMTGTLTDIHARKEAEIALFESEQTLRRTNDELEQEVQARTAVLRGIIDKLWAEIEHRKRIASELSQANEQLQTRASQLRALAGELTTVEHRERKRLSRMLHDHLQQMLASAKVHASCLDGMDHDALKDAAARIVEVLGESLKLSRSLAAELCPPILPEGGLQAAMEWLAHWASEKHGIKVDLAMPKDVLLPPEDVRILLLESVRELLFNISKHAHVSTARVSLGLLEGLGLQIVVSDEGVGFNPSQLWPVGSVCGGFGLFSIRERLDLIGGHLDIDSATGAGSRFRLTVPFNHQPAAPVLVRTPSTRDGQFSDRPVATGPHAIRVLLVDNHRLFVEGIDLLLKKEPDILVVGHAKDGQEAIDLARELVPDVILMDVCMPGTNGIQATRVIHSEQPSIRIIALSIFEDPRHIRIMREAGVNDYKNKGCPASELVDAIRACA